MAVAFYMDLHIPAAISEQLRSRGVDVLTAAEEKTNRLPDEELLQLASSLGRMMLTHDIRFRALAEGWQRRGKQFAGLAYGPAQGVSIGQYVRDLELMAKASDPEEWRNRVVYLPL
jgi:hypothetical protein